MTASRSSRRAELVQRERRGAHRPPGLGIVAAVPWIVASLAIVVVVMVGGGLWNSNRSPDGTAVTSGGAPRPTPVGTSPTTGVAPTTQGSGSVGVVRRDIALVVLNGTPRAGLAATAATKLRASGWQILSTGNHTASDAGTVVYYGGAPLQATAKAVVKQLGGGTAKESAQFGAKRVTVVLGSDFTP